MAFVDIRSFDNSAFMLRALGSLWAYWYPERDALTALLTARGEPFYQVYLDLLDLVADRCRFNVPIFKKQNWYLFTLKESQKGDSAQLLSLYGTSGMVYQGADKPAYGDKASEKYHSYAIDSTIKRVHAVYNRVINPSLIWMENKDFVVDGDRGVITFYSDPFEDPLVPKRDILDSTGAVVDQEIALWFNMSEWDIQNVYTQFGYALGIWMKSSTFYRDFISAIWDMLVLGPTQATLKFAITALTGIPFAEGGETVLHIIDESPNYKHVETDRNVYTFKASTNIIVSEGDVLAAGQSLATAALVVEPEVGQDLAAYGFRGMAMYNTLMSPVGLTGPIVFEDTTVQVNYLGLDANDKAIVRFDVSGFPIDIENFWQRSHREGLRLNRTLGDVLDTRTVRSSPTTPADLPSTINPFQFAIEHIFLNNLYLIYLRPQDFMPGTPGLSSLDLLYPYLPPHTTYMIFVEMTATTDYYSVGDSSDTLGFFKGTNVAESYSDFAVDIGPTIRALPGRCR